MTHYLFFIFYLLIPAALYAQGSDGYLTGRIVDAKEQTALPQATVQLLLLPDSSFVQGTVSRNDGRFRLGIPPKGRDFLMQVSFVGYRTYRQKFSLNRQNTKHDLGIIGLEDDAIALDEAVVTAEAPPVTQIQDTTVYNTAAYRVPEGAMLEDLVKKLPGTEVDASGKITVNGKEIKRIMVDGKEFFSQDTRMALKNLPAEMVDKVKAYDRKSDFARATGVDDGEEEAVLDLTVKKNRKQGWFGNFIGGYGSRNRYEAGAMLNRFTDNLQATLIASGNNTNNQGFSEFGDAGTGMSGKAGAGINTSQAAGANLNIDRPTVKVGTDIRYGHSNRDASARSNSETFLQNGSSHKHSTNTSVQKQHELAANIRLEWNPDSLTSLIFRPGLTYTQTGSTGYGIATTLDARLDSVNYKEAGSTGHANSIRTDGSLLLSRKSGKKKGRNLTLHINYNYSTQNSDYRHFSQTRFHKNDSLDTQNRLNDGRNAGSNYRIRLTYTEPVAADRFLLFSYSYRHNDAHTQKYVYNTDGTLPYPTGARVDSLSNESENRYTTQEMKITFRTVRPKYLYNIGLSLEPQHSKTTTLLGPNAKGPLAQRVWNFSPAVDLRLRFSKHEQLRLMYRGKSNAPRIEDLQEVKDVSDPMNLIYGNPALKPAYTNQLTLFYNRYAAEKQRGVMLNLTFNNTLNSTANQITYHENTGARTTRLVNVNGNWFLNGYLSFNTPFRNRRFTINTYTNASYRNLVGFASLHKSDSQKSATRNLNIYERINGNFRNETCDIGLWGSIRYGFSHNSILKDKSQNTFDYEAGANANISLPWDLYLSTDINYSLKQGYGEGFDRSTVIWNAQLSKNFLKHKQATLRLKIYDILQQQSNLTRSVTANYTQDTAYNTLNSYFMVHFVYRLNTLGKKNTRPKPGKAEWNRTERNMRTYKQPR